MRIFISFASEDRQTAEELHYALLGAGFETFYDRECLPPGEDFNTRIHAAVEAADLFVFLISPHSVDPSTYALTELRHARNKWKHPGGRVLPVIVQRVSRDLIPAYLRAVSILDVEGNIAAEITQAVSSLAASLRSGGQEARSTPANSMIEVREATPGPPQWTPFTTNVDVGSFANRKFIRVLLIGLITACASYTLLYLFAIRVARSDSVDQDLTEFLKQNATWREDSNTMMLMRPHFVIRCDLSTAKIAHTPLREQVNLSKAVAPPITLVSIGMAALAGLTPNEVRWLLAGGSLVLGIVGYVSGRYAAETADDERLVGRLASDLSVWRNADRELRRDCQAIRSGNLTSTSVAVISNKYINLRSCVSHQSDHN